MGPSAAAAVAPGGGGVATDVCILVLFARLPLQPKETAKSTCSLQTLGKVPSAFFLNSLDAWIKETVRKRAAMPL